MARAAPCSPHCRLASFLKMQEVTRKKQKRAKTPPLRLFSHYLPSSSPLVLSRTGKQAHRELLHVAKGGARLCRKTW